jgi:hypothetical protein
MQGEWSKQVLPKAEKAYRDGIEVVNNVRIQRK